MQRKCPVIAALETLINDSWAPTVSPHRSGMPEHIEILMPPTLSSTIGGVCSIAECKPDGTGRVEQNRLYLAELGWAHFLSDVLNPFEQFRAGFVLKPTRGDRQGPIGIEIWCPHKPWNRRGCSSRTRVLEKIRYVIAHGRTREYLIQPFLKPVYHADIDRFEWWAMYATRRGTDYCVSRGKWFLGTSIRQRDVVSEGIILG